MVVEIIAVGTEILLGNIVNTNAQFLAKRCAVLGLAMYHQTVVGDNGGRLLEAINTAKSRSDIIILTGGLGPTEDDITRDICAKAFDRVLYIDEAVQKRIEEYFVHRGDVKVAASNIRQAMVPSGAIVLQNDNGTAPGLIIEGEDCTAILLPGPPNELIPMFEEQVYPYLNSLGEETIYSKMVKLCGVSESLAEEMILDMIDAQSNPTLATYAKTGEVHIRVTARAADEASADRLISPVIDELYKRFGENIYTTDENESLEAAVVRLLKKHELTISAAESCTGGLVAATIINVSGASDVIKESYVTYCDEAKHRLLGVEDATLKEFSAVSSQTARQMAEGCARAAGSDIAVSVTGVAGPGNDGDKPAGLVFIGCCYNGETIVNEYHFKGSRQKVRDNAVIKALDMVRRMVIRNFGA
ncbi:MAG: competence/damage-inducible protein A [Lachnospiraceae bacterium]|nr:competence/damage-inducible protein A [Lachnospiraceae bacterium]